MPRPTAAAKVQPLPLAADPVEAPKAKRAPPEPDFSKPIELGGWWLPYIIATSGASSFVLGSLLNSGTEVSGIVKRVLLLPTGVCAVGVQAPGPDGEGTELRWLYFLEGHGIERLK